MRLLVTGAAGFIGSAVVRAALGAHEVVAYDALTYAGNPANLAEFEGQPGFTFVHADICDAAAVAQALDGCDAVLNLAAESHVDRSIGDPAPFVCTNVVGTEVLLHAVRTAFDTRSTPIRFVQVSTDEVYGSLALDEPRRFRTGDPIAPNSPYAASKAAADQLVRAYHRTFGLDTVICRSSNNFGPRQHPEKLIPRFVTNLIDGLRVPVYGDGLYVRDWIHVDDNAEALLLALDRGESGGVYNIGGVNEVSNLKLTRTLLGLLGRGEDMIEHVADRPGHDRRYAIDPSEFDAAFNWRPSRSDWPAALEATVDWYRDNEAWWRPLVTR